MKHRLTVAAFCTCLWLQAHPMGNFSISHYARLEAQPTAIDLTYALDLAEIPTFELLRDWKLERSSPREQLEGKALEQARAWVANLFITVDGRPLTAEVRTASLAIEDGAGNLPVLRITAQATLPASFGRLEYEDRNFPDRAGWKEIVIGSTGGVVLEKASHSTKDSSKALTAYPDDPMLAPPQDVRAMLEWKRPVPPVVIAAAQEPPKPKATPPQVVEPVEQPRPALPSQQAQVSPGVASAPAGTVQRGDYLSQLLGRKELSLGLILTALATAFGLGAVHAMSPGHGKTIVAAYLVGSRGTFKHALFLGAMVTFTHTISVFLLGIGTMFLSRYVVPDKIVPVLGVISGLMIVWIGGTLFWKRLNLLAGQSLPHPHHHHHHHDHDHDHEHAHAAAHAHGGHPHSHSHGHDHGHHHDHDHHHGPGGHTHVPEGEVTFGSLVGLAVSGGMVPCPSALVLLLSAIAIGRITFGLALLTAFSLGLAMVLIAIGCAVLYAKNLLPATSRVAQSPLVGMMPVISAGIITIVGLVMTAVAAGVVKPGWN